MPQSTLAGMLQAFKSSDDMTVTIDAGWFNGRAAYGGLVGALAVEGMAKCLPDPKPLRSLLINFVGPVPPEKVTVEPTILRAGRSVTQATANITRDGQVLCHASAAFGLSRPGKSAPPIGDFSPAPRDSVPALDPAMGMLPGFLQNFEIHWTGGGIPLSGSNDYNLGMWVRHRHAVSDHPIASIVAIGDVPAPLMMSHYTKLIKASSLSWSMEFVRAPEDIDSEWFYLDYTLEAASGGYSQQSGRIFDEQGNLCALTRQCMVYFE